MIYNQVITTMKVETSILRTSIVTSENPHSLLVQLLKLLYLFHITNRSNDIKVRRSST